MSVGASTQDSVSRAAAAGYPHHVERASALLRIIKDSEDPEAREQAERQLVELDRDGSSACSRCGRDACAGDCPSRLLRAFTLDELLEHRFPPRRAILYRGDVPVFREGHLGQISALRGVGKSWFAETLGIVAASGPDVEALGFRAPEPSRVVYLDAEMAGEEVQERFRRLSGILGAPRSANLSIIGADWQDDYLPRLDTAEGQAAVEPFVAGADLIFLDNRSCLFDPEGEKDPSAWQPAQDWLLSLRRRGKSVMTIHHANRQGTARGHSKPEDAMNLLLNLSRPPDYVQSQGARFVVTFDKARGVHGAAAAPFIAQLTDTGWTVESTEHAETNAVERKLIDYLAAAAKVGDPPKTATAAIRNAGVRRADGLKALGELIRRGRVSHSKDEGYRLAA